jgi:Flp pilus assembly protein TadG
MQTRGNTLAPGRDAPINLRREDGQALVELALVVPLLLFIIFAIIDFGLAINQYNNTTNLANLGARATAVLASSNTTPGSCIYTPKSGTATTYTTLVGYIDCEGASEGNLSQASVTVCDGSGTTTFSTGDTLAVRINSTFNWLGILTGGVGRIGGVTGGLSTITIGSTGAMRMEATVTNPTSSTWLGADSHDYPGGTTTIPAPTITTTGC